MKEHLLRALTILAGFGASSYAAAQTAEAPALPTVSFIGSGCPQDSDATKYRWEGNSLVVNFSGMVASKGEGISLIQSRKTCSITLNLNVPRGLSYSLAGYKASGFEDLAETDSRTLTVTNFFQGQSETTTLSDEAAGPLSNDFAAQHINAASENQWSPCDVQRAQTITVAVRVASGADRTVASTATLDTIRLPIRLKRCPTAVNN